MDAVASCDDALCKFSGTLRTMSGDRRGQYQQRINQEAYPPETKNPGERRGLFTSIESLIIAAEKAQQAQEVDEEVVDIQV